MATAFVLDRKSILDRLGDDEEIYAMMADMFIQDVENNCAALLAAMNSGDGTALQREAHTVKGLLATFSDDAGAEVARDIEFKAKQNALDGVAPAIETTLARLREVSAVLQADLASR